MSVVNMVFGSFNLHDEFFAKHHTLRPTASRVFSRSTGPAQIQLAVCTQSS